jgi:HAD superfamily hydrolase (TIGR01549 family)
MAKLRAVLFDLDDTLFDHAFAARRALEGIHKDLPRFADWPFDVLEDEYGRRLEEVHLRVLDGELTLEEARLDRMRHLMSTDSGKSPSDAEASEMAGRFRDGYQGNRRAADGARELLGSLRERGITVGIVTNNVTAEQKDKLAFCKLDSLVDFMVTSEEIGPPKPERAMFEAALDRAGCRASEAVVVGDSWESDVLGAKNAGIRAVWYNPRGLPRMEDLPVAEIRAFRPLDGALEAILGPEGIP